MKKQTPVKSTPAQESPQKSQQRLTAEKNADAERKKVEDIIEKERQDREE